MSETTDQAGQRWEEALAPEDQFLLAIASGRPQRLPDTIEDVEGLLGRIAEHRLAGRCRRHAAALRARGLPGALAAGIDALCRETLSEYRRNRAAVDAAGLALGDALGVVIKGFTTFLLTDDAATLRCGDVDLVVPDGTPVIAYLQSQGFARTRQPFLHELGEFTRDGVEIDVQRGFPISCRPVGVLDMPGGEIAARGIMRTREIRFADLQHAGLAVPAGEGRLRIPSPEMAVLIAAAHAFMNYVNIWSISHREKAWLRLSELADIRELATAPGFSRVRFQRLVEQFEAQDIAAWTDWIWTQLDGAPVPAFPDTPSRNDFPLNLWWNLWISLRPSLPALLRQRWYPWDGIAERLEAMDRRASAAGLAGEKARDLMPLWEASDRSGAHQVTVRCEDGGAEIVLKGPPASGNMLLRVRFEGAVAEELAAFGPNSEQGVKGVAAPVSIEKQEASFTVKIGLPCSAVSRGKSVKAFVGLLIEDDGHIVMSTIVPLFEP